MGWLMMQARRGWRVTLETRQAHGLTLLCAAVPAPPELGERTALRRLHRAAALLRRKGVCRVLTAADFTDWDALAQHGLRPVDAAPLCQMLAGRLALAALAEQGALPERAVVALRGTRVSRPLFQAAEFLCPRVRGLIVDAPVGGVELGAHLRAEYGAPVLETGAQPPGLTLEFSPTGATPGHHLHLWGVHPRLGGLRLEPPAGVVPEGVERLAWTALLWEEGRLAQHEIQIFPTGGSPIALDRTGQTTYNTKIM